MAKLVINLNGMHIRDYPLKDERVSIGRNSTNDIMLNEAVVSGEHAAIQVKPKPSITDLNSTNGTEVNGFKISGKTHIRDKDVITIGSYELSFLDEEVQDFASTMLVYNDPSEKQEDGDKAALKLLNGPRAGEMMTIQNKRTNLGSPGVQVAVILHTKDGYALQAISYDDKAIDVSLNGQNIKSDLRLLKHGDDISIADAKLKFVTKF